MKGINKAILVGIVGKDPDFKKISDSFSVANFSLATTRSYKKDDEWVDDTEWHNIAAYNKLAEIVNKSVTKGSAIYVEGEIKTRSYDDKDGNKKYVTEIIANTISVIKKKDGEGAPSGSDLDAQDDDLPF